MPLEAPLIVERMYNAAKLPEPDAGVKSGCMYTLTDAPVVPAYTFDGSKENVLLSARTPPNDRLPDENAPIASPLRTVMPEGPNEPVVVNRLALKSPNVLPSVVTFA